MFSFRHCPNYLPPNPPRPNLGNFFRASKTNFKRVWRSLRCCRIWSALEVRFSNWF